MDAVRLSSSIVHKMGETQTIQKRSSNVFRVLDFYFLIFCTCVLCAGEFYFLGNPKVDDDD